MKRRKARRRSSPASSSSAAADGSSVASILPADAGASSSSDGAGEPGDVPPLPPDPGADAGASSSSDAPGDRGEARAGADDPERAGRLVVLRMIFGGVFLALPASYGGGPLSDEESAMLAEAWELPLRPYWDTMMGPWAGALLTTTAILAPRVMVARAKLAAAGVSPGDQVG